LHFHFACLPLVSVAVHILDFVVAATSSPNGTAGVNANTQLRGSDRKHVDTVLGVENGRIVLASGGIDHTIDIAIVDAVTDGLVRLQATTAETVRSWH
jgi:hypothetical protein